MHFPFSGTVTVTGDGVPRLVCSNHSAAHLDTPDCGDGDLGMSAANGKYDTTTNDLGPSTSYYHDDGSCSWLV